jgi:hypothetical protein
MPTSSDFEITRRQDLYKVDVQLRDLKDLFITCPPQSGLSMFLKQVQKHINVSEHFHNYRTIMFDCKTQNQSGNLFESIAQVVLSELGTTNAVQARHQKGKRKLLSVFEEFVKQNEKQKTVFIIDNLENVQEKDAVILLENVRVIAESRTKNPYLQNIVFILSGHSLDLRKLDPKHSSPFNTATQIYLDDLPNDDSIAIIKDALFDRKYSPLIPEYIDFLTFGHPYFLNRICYHVRNDEIKIEPGKGVTFELIDSISDQLIGEKRDDAIRYLDVALGSLSPTSSAVLRKIINGVFFKNLRFSDSLKELKLLGIVNNTRNGKWHIRNFLFDQYIRQQPKWNDTIRSNNFVPRRLFVNVEGYKILFDLENNLREFVVSQLFDAFGKDWTNVLERNSSLNEVVVKWKNMKGQNMAKSWHTYDDLPVVCYGLFPEIKKIIDEYWGSIFEKYFKPKSIFVGTFESLEELRNKIAHNRPLSDKDFDVLSSIAKQLNDCMFENSLA